MNVRILDNPIQNMKYPEHEDLHNKFELGITYTSNHVRGQCKDEHTSPNINFRLVSFPLN
jgi:hypothetical protein